MKFNCPLIAVADMERARKFYEEVMGQRVILDFGENITFAGDFSLQTKDSWARFINRREDEIVTESLGAELYFEEEEDFPGKAACIKEYGCRLVHDVTEYPWGQSVIRFFDPDGHIIEVGESMRLVARRFIAQGLSVEETAARTQHPIAFVKSCL